MTEHAHVTEIKQPARSGNNQDYYSQIAQHLNWSDKCFRFDIATRLASTEQGGPDDENDDDEHEEDEHKPDSEVLHVSHYHVPTRRLVNYFETAERIANGIVPNTILPPRFFSSSSTAFRLAVKPSLRVSIGEASELYGLPELRLAIADYFRRIGCSAVDFASERMQTWFKVRVQQPNYHDQQSFEQPQSLLATPPSARHPGGHYDFAIVSETDGSDWPSSGLRGTLLWDDTWHILTTLQGTQLYNFALFFTSFIAIHFSSTFSVLTSPPHLRHLIQPTLLLACTS